MIDIPNIHYITVQGSNLDSAFKEAKKQFKEIDIFPVELNNFIPGSTLEEIYDNFVKSKNTGVDYGILNTESAHLITKYTEDTKEVDKATIYKASIYESTEPKTYTFNNLNAAESFVENKILNCNIDEATIETISIVKNVNTIKYRKRYESIPEASIEEMQNKLEKGQWLLPIYSYVFFVVKK